MTDKRTYWAAEQDPHQLVTNALSRFCNAMNTARKIGTLDRTRRMLMAYYGRGVDGRDTTRTRLAGKQGELAKYVHNVVRPLNAQVLALICGQRPGLKPVATNTDADSIAQTALADGIRSHYERTLEVPAVETDVVRGGTLAGQFWAVESWKRSKGAAYGIDEAGRLQYEGGIELISLPWWRAAADPLARRPVQRQWFLFKSPANRFDLAAEYPSCAAKLLEGAESKNAIDWAERITGYTDFEQLDVLFGDTLEAEEGCWVWELRHVSSPALPKGRQLRFVNGDCMLFDSAQYVQAPQVQVPAGADSAELPAADLERESAPTETTEAAPGGAVDVGYPYAEGELHAYDYCPERIVGTATGHTSQWDVLGNQEMFDVCTVTLATVVNLFGLPHLWAGPGGAAGITAEPMSSGPIILETKTKPEVLKFEALSKDVVDAIGILRELAVEAGSLNKTVMGETDPGMPAQLAALQRAQAVQVHQTATGEYVRLVENIATGLLKLSQRFAKSEQTAEIAGSAGQWELKKWKRENIAGVPRFAVEIVNPLTQSFEGRQAEAEFMAAQVDPKTGKPWLTREGYLTLKSTGSLKEPLEADQAKLELLTQHKQLLRGGKGLPPIDMAASKAQLDAWSLANEDAAKTGGPPPGPAPGPVFLGGGAGDHVRLNKLDPHWYAIPEYFSVLLSPSSRENPAVVRAVGGVIQESMRLWASLTPDELAVMGGPALPSQLAASQPSAPAGAAPGEEPPPPGDESPAPAMAGPGEPSLPKPPPDPINGQQQGPEAAALQ